MSGNPDKDIDCVFSAKCLSSLSALPVTTLSTEYGPLLNCLCAWDRTTDVLKLINERIVEGMNGTRREVRFLLLDLEDLREQRPEPGC